MSMRVLVTGATGYLGSAIAARLARAGHEVSGLTRSPDRGRSLEAVGVKPIAGDLARPDDFMGALRNADAMVHVALDTRQTAGRDEQALLAARDAAQDGRLRRLLYTSGVRVHGDTEGTIVDERSPLRPASIVRWRPAHEEVALELAARGIDVVIFRPGMVYGGAGGIFGGWFREARDRRSFTYPGEGRQRWCTVHRDDVAEAYVLGLEHGRGGERFLLVNETRFTVRQLAEAVAGSTGAEARPQPRAALLEELGEEGAALLLDQQATAVKARRELGWVPAHLSLVNEVEALHREWLAAQQTPVA